MFQADAAEAFSFLSFPFWKGVTGCTGMGKGRVGLMQQAMYGRSTFQLAQYTNYSPLQLCRFSRLINFIFSHLCPVLWLIVQKSHVCAVFRSVKKLNGGPRIISLHVVLHRLVRSTLHHWSTTACSRFFFIPTMYFISSVSSDGAFRVRWRRKFVLRFKRVKYILILFLFTYHWLV
jgi:hypothetical protein